MEQLKTPRGYAEDFDPEWYLENYIKTLNKQLETGGILPFSLDFLHDTFKTGRYHGDKLLDIGTGPTVHSVISASRHVREIHLSDISPRNRDILQKWRQGEPNVTEVFEYICKKENEGVTVAKRMNMVREKVKQVFDIDMRQPEPLEGARGMYDVIVASLLLCSVARNKEEFAEVLRKAIDMMKPGGYLIVTGLFNDKYYRVGDFRFTGSDMNKKEFEGVFLEEGLKILDWRETDPQNYMPDYKKSGYSVGEGVFAMISQKV